jgi:hypothetical protein
VQFYVIFSLILVFGFRESEVWGQVKPPVAPATSARTAIRPETEDRLFPVVGKAIIPQFKIYSDWKVLEFFDDRRKT